MNQDQNISLARFICVLCFVMTGAYFLFQGFGSSQQGSTNPSPPIVASPVTENSAFTPRSVHSTDRKAFGVPVKWGTVEIGSGYTMCVGRYLQYVVAFEIIRNGSVVLRDFTPGGEYILFLDPKSGDEMSNPSICNGSDGSPQLAFGHRSISDDKLDAKFSYRVTDDGLKLITYRP